MRIEPKLFKMRFEPTNVNSFDDGSSSNFYRSTGKIFSNIKWSKLRRDPDLGLSQLDRSQKM